MRLPSVVTFRWWVLSAAIGVLYVAMSWPGRQSLTLPSLSTLTV